MLKRQDRSPDPGAPGELLARWRRERRRSQLALSLDAGISTRHLSFIETGRAQPSRAVILALCEALAVPPRGRNDILVAFGLAPAVAETSLDAPAMADVVVALRLMLGGHEPFGAVAFDRNWDVVMANAAYTAWLGDAWPAGAAPLALLAPPRPNVLRLLFGDPRLRALVSNWPHVAGTVFARARREAMLDPDPVRLALIDEIAPHAPVVREPPAETPVLATGLMLAGGTVRLLNTIATLGTSVDLTLRELRIEMFHPADAASDAAVRRMAAPGAGRRPD